MSNTLLSTRGIYGTALVYRLERISTRGYYDRLLVTIALEGISASQFAKALSASQPVLVLSATQPGVNISVTQPGLTMSKRGPQKSEARCRGTRFGMEGKPAPSANIVDVWSRTSPKYRIRAVVLLAVNVMLFASVGCFAFWLRSGRPRLRSADAAFLGFARHKRG